MKNKLQYLIIFILIISNIFLAYNFINKKKSVKDNEFKREMSYLKNRIGFDNNQLEEAKKYEYKDSCKYSDTDDLTSLNQKLQNLRKYIQKKVFLESMV